MVRTEVQIFCLTQTPAKVFNQSELSFCRVEYGRLYCTTENIHELDYRDWAGCKIFASRIVCGWQYMWWMLFGYIYSQFDRKNSRFVRWFSFTVWYDDPCWCFCCRILYRTSTSIGRLWPLYHAVPRLPGTTPSWKPCPRSLSCSCT